MRAFRPSSFGEQDEFDDDALRAKLLNVQHYAERAEAGLPLFEAHVVPEKPEVGKADLAARK